MSWVGRYVGLPFVDGGRTRAGVDCWGLVRLALASERNIELPSYGEISATELRRIAGAIQAEAERADPWIAVAPDDRRAWDLVVMERRSAPIHLGLLTSPDMVLHVERKVDAAHVPLKSIKFRSYSIFRHRALAQT